MDCYWRILGHDTYPAPAPSLRVIKIVSEQKALQSLADKKVPDIVVYFHRPSVLSDLKYTEFFNKFIWSYEKPVRFRENSSEHFIIKIGNQTRNIYLYKRIDNNQTITRLEVIAITAGELFFCD